MEEKENIKISDQDIIDLLSNDLEETRQHVDEVSDLRTNDLDLLRGKPYKGDDKRKERGYSTVVSKVIANTVNWAIAGLVEIFTDDFFGFKYDNSQLAEDMKSYVRKIWFRQQDGEKKNYEFIHTALTARTGGFLKIYHHEEYDLKHKTFDEMPMEMFQKLEADEKATVTDFEMVEEYLVADMPPIVYYKNVKAVYKVNTFFGPKIEAVRPEDIGISPETGGDLDTARLVYHRTVRNLDYVRRMENAGIYKKGSVDRVMNNEIGDDTEGLSQSTEQEVENRFWVDNVEAPESATEPSVNDSSKEMLQPANSFNLYEIYTKLDIDGDGLLEPVIINMSGNVVFSIQLNKYGRPVFRCGKPYLVPFQEQQQTAGVLLEDEQKIMTNLNRMQQDAAANSTYRNPITNDKKTFELLKKRGPNSVIYGDPDKVGDISPPDTSQFILKSIEMQQGDIENITGITRYNQGLDANSLNKTFGGMNLIMTASQQRQKLAARILGWTFRDVVYDIVRCLEMYPTPEYTEILQRNNVQEKKIELSDVAIDVGVSFQEKFAASQQLAELGMWHAQVGVPSNLTTPEEMMKTKRKQYELVGINTEGLLPTDDQFIERRKKQAVAGAGQGDGGQPSNPQQPAVPGMSQ